MPSAGRCICFAFLVCLVGGCQKAVGLPDAVQVKGRVTDAGTPLHVEGREVAIGRVTVGFCPLADDGQPVEATTADVDAEGNFEVVDGLKPGKYLITVRQWDPYPSTDRLNGKFDEKSSKIVREFAGTKAELVIDVSNPEG